MKEYNSKKVAAAFLLAISATGCGAVYAPNPLQDGNVAVMADAKGMRAFMDGMNGFVTNGKASPDQDTAHWIHRKAEEREETTRKTAPGFLSGLFARPSNQGGAQ